MTLRDLLIRAYPRSWRDEFGSELTGILDNKKLTPALIADVLASASLQHLRDDPWKICALGLALWTSGLLIIGFAGFVDYPEFVWCYSSDQMFLFAAGAWTGLRENSGIWRATVASGKAALVPIAVYIVVSSLRMLHYWGGLREIHGHNVYYWVWKNAVMTILASLLFGLAGASLARFINHFRQTAPARP